MQSVIDIAAVSPFVQCFTLAQCALVIYRKNFMPENKLGIVPKNNYHMQTAQSKVCRKWLTYLNYFHENIGQNTHFFIQPEVKLSDCGLIVDGYCRNYPTEGPQSPKGVCFEFFGCWHHGCQRCLKSNPIDLRKKTRTERLEEKGLWTKQLYYQTLAKLDRLKELGYTCHSIWEHEFVSFLKKNKELDKQILNHPFVDYASLNARDAIYGGRTEVGRLYYKQC